MGTTPSLGGRDCSKNLTFPLGQFLAEFFLAEKRRVVVLRNSFFLLPLQLGLVPKYHQYQVVGRVGWSEILQSNSSLLEGELVLNLSTDLVPDKGFRLNYFSKDLNNMPIYKLVLS